ncbi:MAG: sigma-70 family RNA polymerase sigma factor [Syntrophomonadaceae bacterium]|nr:sigma-70 family RNA polymerase sigma factor [Syntrophomonadaceae bacterium]
MISDESLAIDTLNGDLSAFEELVNRYKHRVFSIVYRLMGQYQEAEDVTQEVFINVFEKLYQFDADKKFAPWIYRIASNTSISALRKKKNVIVVDFDEVPQVAYESTIAGESYNPQHLYEREELKGLINDAITELPESYRMVIILRYQMDLDNQEIADILDISKENIEVRVHRARKALRQIIQKRWEERGMANELPASR